MPLKKSAGNMYPWVTHTHSPLGGDCAHKCVYCYVDNPRWGRAPRYCGAPRLLPDELKVHYGSGRTIFIEHMSDLFADDVPTGMIHAVLCHCSFWPCNTYVFQTKNPARFEEWLTLMPPQFILGTTIETNRDTPTVSKAPPPRERYEAMMRLRSATAAKLFVTIEPILRFDLDVLAKWIVDLRPDFLNIGADSKNHGLDEPTQADVLALVAELRKHGIEVREKHNLQRLLAN